MDANDHLAALRSEGAAVVKAGSQGLDPTVDHCPGWTVGDVIQHLGYVHLWVRTIVERRATEYVERRDLPAPPDGADLVPWFETNLAGLVAALEDAGPDATVWTWTGDRSARFWFRRMAQETAVHRWDAESGHADPAPIAADLAVDGVDELLMTFGSGMDLTSKLGASTTFHLHATDVAGEWTVTVEPGGLRVDKAHGKGDAALRGTASDLLLFLWGRVPRARLETFGDVALLDRWQAEVKI